MYCFCRILISSSEILIITVIWKTKWINHICKIMSKRHNILPTKTTLFISSARKIENVQKFKSFSNSYFIANDNNINVICSYTTAFNVLAVLYFSGNFHLLKHYLRKVPQNCFDLFNRWNKSGMQISKFSFALGKIKNWFKCTVMEIGKALINNRLHASILSWKFCIPTIYNFTVIYPSNLLFS